MKAIGFTQPLPISHPEALLELDLPEPVPGPRDLVVDVRAVSVNPVDTKVRRNATPPAAEPRVLGWDAAGVVTAVGDQVTGYKVGDRVWYAGSIKRPGSNAERQAVDERIVGRMPASLDFARAAALPLTTITAWEMLFDRLRVPRGGGDGEALLIVGAAGGVGSILTQLAAKLTKLRVIATASRPDSVAWLRQLGAHDVIDHTQPIPAQLAALGVPGVRHIASLTHTEQHYPALVEAMAPFGQIAAIDDFKTIDLGLLKGKSGAFLWELMFTRSMFETPDMDQQRALLDQVAGLVDQGVIATTVAEHFGALTVANLRKAHERIESHTARGKIVLER